MQRRVVILKAIVFADLAVRAWTGWVLDPLLADVRRLQGIQLPLKAASGCGATLHQLQLSQEDDGRHLRNPRIRLMLISTLLSGAQALVSCVGRALPDLRGVRVACFARTVLVAAPAKLAVAVAATTLLAVAVTADRQAGMFPGPLHIYLK